MLKYESDAPILRDTSTGRQRAANLACYVQAACCRHMNTASTLTFQELLSPCSADAFGAHRASLLWSFLAKASLLEHLHAAALW